MGNKAQCGVLLECGEPLIYHDSQKTQIEPKIPAPPTDVHQENKKNDKKDTSKGALTTFLLKIIFNGKLNFLFKTIKEEKVFKEIINNFVFCIKKKPVANCLIFPLFLINLDRIYRTRKIGTFMEKFFGKFDNRWKSFSIFYSTHCFKKISIIMLA